MPVRIASALCANPVWREGDAGGFVSPKERIQSFAKADERGEFREFCVVETASQLAEISVAGTGQRGNDGQFAMAEFCSAADSFFLCQLEEARAVQIFIWRHDALLQGRDGNQRFDGGAWRVVARQCTVGHDAALSEIFLAERQMMGRDGGHDVNFSVHGVHDDHCAFKSLVAEDFLSGLL